MSTERQRNLFSMDDLTPTVFAPATAAADPATSAIAEAKVTKSGQVERNAARVLGLVCLHPGFTSVELWTVQRNYEDAMDRHEVSRRLSTNLNKRRVRQGPPRRCRINGTMMVTWFAT